ncbi:MAG: hypothetical protein LBV38_03295 [Alistipes sp.]|jgi:hypothetical protein|nr:hypothetical protein [Alistipes sp.]
MVAAVAMLAMSLAATSCITDDDILGKPDQPVVVPQDDLTQVEFTVTTPPASRPGTRVVDTAFENTIGDLIVTVEKQNESGVFIFETFIPVTNYTLTEGGNATFRIGLQPSDTPVRFLVRNFRDVDSNFTDAHVQAVMQVYMGKDDEFIRNWIFSDARDHFLGIGSYDEKAPMMSMAGEKTLPSLEFGRIVNITIPMLRSVARADIQLDMSDNSRDFVPQEAWLYRSNHAYCVLPLTADKYADPTNPVKVISPSKSSRNEFPGIQTPISVTVDDVETGLFATAYIPESEAATTEAERLEATCLVVGGYLDGDTSTMHYYRLDFDSGIAGHPFGQILRNHRYVFNITSVTADGAATADDAANNASAAINVDIVPWDDNVTDIVFPGTNDYFSIDTHNVDLLFEPGSEGQFEIVSTVDFSMSLDGVELQSTAVDAAGSVGANISNSGVVEMYDGAFVVKVTRTAYSAPEATYTVSVQSLNYNYEGTSNAQLQITVGGKTMTVDIAQALTASYFPPRTLNVHTLVNTYGELGTGNAAGGTYFGSADELRNMLLNTSQFGPAGTGIVTLDEISFTRSAATDYTVDADAPTLRTTLEDVDVLMVPGYTGGNANSISPACAQVIVEWSQDPTHTLILTVDQIGSNTVLRGALQPVIGYNMLWADDDSSLKGLLDSVLDLVFGALDGFDYTLGSAPDTTTTGDDVFLSASAPFGAVDRTTTYDVSDTTRTYVEFSAEAPLPSSVVPILNVVVEHNPLISTDPTTYTELQAMVMGVDTQNGIVWMGDSQIGGDGYMDDSADLTKIMGNLWAWIVDRANP